MMCATALTAFASAAAAQTADTPASSRVGEVVVTARHRTESLQKVPIAISVVEGSQAVAQNLNNIKDISQIVPAVDFRTGASNKDRTVFIRGIGTISTSPGVEPSVSTVVDGVVLARAGQSTLDLLDLERLEVLQGPQGTLFGKNSSAGVINVVTRNPTPQFNAYIDAQAYTGQEFRLLGGVSGPIIQDKLDGLISAFTAQYKGNVENIYNGVDKEDNGYQHTGVRAKFIATPTSNLKLTLGADYTFSEDSTPTGVFVSTNRVAYPTGVVTPNPALADLLGAYGVTPSSDNRTIATNTNSSVHDKNGGVSLQADWVIPGGSTITSITAYRQWKNVQYQDYDMLPAPTPPPASPVPPGNFAQGIDTGHLDFHQTSEELRIATPKGQFIDYVAGVYFLNAVDNETYERDLTQLSAATPPVPILNSGIAPYGSTDTNFSVFTEANLNFTSNFRAIVGFREIWDWLSYYHSRVSTSPTPLPGIGVSTVNGPGSEIQQGYADRFGLQYDFGSNINTYITYSRGYKGPAYNVFFNMSKINQPPLAPETSNDYEAGIKATLFDQRLRANLAGFITDFDNYQANFTALIGGAIVSNLINAGSVSTKGFEGDLLAKPIDPVNLSFNFLYDDAKVDDFNCPIGAPTSCNINGQPLPFAPTWKLHLEGDYTIKATHYFNVALETDYSWQSQVQYQLAETPDTIQPAYGIWNASIALLGTTNDWQARFLVKNILNQHYSPYLAYGTFAGVVRWVPRDDDTYFGINIRKGF
jgi:iron complex outermembrane receptor protein